MAKPDDHSIERTREEADRLLGELDRQPTSPGGGTASSLPAPGSPAPAPPAASQRSVPMSWLVLGSLVFGAVVSALTMALVFRQPERPQAPSATTPPVADSPPVLKSESTPLDAPRVAPPPPPPPLPQRDVPSKAQHPEFQASSPPATGAWGPASAYKFGRLPDSTYPDSCAFSQTDSAGQTIISRSDVDYWACRDEGGNPRDGFSVVWVDGKRTTYTFGSGGAGSVVGTNAQTYPISWRNDSRNGTNVIIISHSDGATSWIPGRVN
jgi:hypothetical protein